MRETEDGFVIAEEDLRLRGAGDVLGVQQSGLPKFRVADLEIQTGLMKTAQDDARLLLEQDPGLKSKRGHALRHFCAECDHARDVGGIGGAGDVPDHDLVDRVRIDLRPLDRLTHGDTTQVHGGDPGQFGAGSDERRSCAGDDDDVTFCAQDCASFSLLIA